MIPRRPFVPVLCALMAAAPVATAVSVEVPTFNEHIAPIVFSKCAEVKNVPEGGRFALVRQLTLPLDVNKDGILDAAELKPGIDNMLPFMRGFGEIGFD